MTAASSVLTDHGCTAAASHLSHKFTRVDPVFEIQSFCLSSPCTPKRKQQTVIIKTKTTIWSAGRNPTWHPGWTATDSVDKPRTVWLKRKLTKKDRNLKTKVCEHPWLPPNNNAVSKLNTPAAFKFELDSRFVFSTMIVESRRDNDCFHWNSVDAKEQK